MEACEGDPTKETYVDVDITLRFPHDKGYFID